VSPVGKSSIYQFPVDLRDPRAIEVGRRVRERRRALGLTQAELASPLTKSYISLLEQGRTLPSLRVLWLLSRRLGTGVGDLVDGVNELATGSYNGAHGIERENRTADARGNRHATAHRR
jgi:X-X-X-Leu-X-X-Gly heptad repeat protein